MAERWRLLVFDWDGTLLDSLGAIVDCVEVALAELELPPPPEVTIRGTVGLGLREAVATLLPDGDEALRDRMTEAFRHHWWTTYAARPRLIAGARETLVALGAAGYRLAVATGKSRAGLEADFERTGTRDLFVATRTVSEAASKPAPEMLLSLMEELQAGADQTLMVGDTTLDLEMAANAGCPAVGVTSGGLAASALAPFAPLTILPSVASLPRWLAEGRR